jgi:ketosteroid isomerase-like protein
MYNDSLQSSEDAIRTVKAWQEAANAQDIDHLLAVSDETIEIVGPRGVASGHQMLRDWMARAGLTLETRQTFARQ